MMPNGAQGLLNIFRETMFVVFVVVFIYPQNQKCSVEYALKKEKEIKQTGRGGLNKVLPILFWGTKNCG